MLGFFALAIILQELSDVVPKIATYVSSQINEAIEYFKDLVWGPNRWGAFGGYEHWGAFGEYDPNKFESYKRPDFALIVTFTCLFIISLSFIAFCIVKTFPLVARKCRPSLTAKVTSCRARVFAALAPFASFLQALDSLLASLEDAARTLIPFDYPGVHAALGITKEFTLLRRIGTVTAA